MASDKQYAYGVVENAVELTHSLRDNPGFKDWFDKNSDLLQGRAGLVSAVVDLSERIERIIGDGWAEETYDWYLTMDAIAEAVLSTTSDVPLYLLSDDKIRAVLADLRADEGEKAEAAAREQDFTTARLTPAQREALDPSDSK